MILNDNDKDLELKKEPLERFRTFYLIFEKPLPYLVMNDLLSEKKFISKYSRINKAKMDDEIQALILYDYLDINYVLTLEKIEAKSTMIEEPGTIKESLKSMADQIIKLYDLDFKYKLEDGVDFRYIENYNLQKTINGSEIIKLLKKEFGNNLFLIQCKFIIKSKDGDNLINIVYPNSKDLKDKRLLIEANEKDVVRLYEALKNE